LKVDIWELQRLLDGNWFLCQDRLICFHKRPRTIKKAVAQSPLLDWGNVNRNSLLQESSKVWQRHNFMLGVGKNLEEVCDPKLGNKS